MNIKTRNKAAKQQQQQTELLGKQFVWHSAVASLCPEGTAEFQTRKQ